MWAIYKLHVKTSIKNPALLINVFLPLVMVTVLGTTIGKSSAAIYTNLMNNLIVLSMMTSLLVSFGFSLLEMKKSVIMKRIGSTTITKPMVFLAFFCYSITIGYLTIGWTLLLAQIYAWGGIVAGLQGSSFAERNNGFMWTSINWGYWVMGLLIGTVLTTSISIVFVSLSPSVDIFNMFGFLYLVLNMFIGGMFLPAASIPSWMTHTSYVLPHSYIMHLFQGSTDPSGWLSGSMNVGINPFTSQVIVAQTHPYADIFAPIAFTGLFIFLGIKNFKYA